MLLPEFVHLEQVLYTVCTHICFRNQHYWTPHVSANNDSLPKLELPLLLQTMQLPRSILQLLRFLLIFLCAVP